FELRESAEKACVGALARFDPPAKARAVAVTFISSGSHEDAVGIVRAFGLEDDIEEIEVMDERVAVLVLRGNGSGPAAVSNRATLGKLMTVLEAALNREIQVVEE